jgi:GNAT superfamily N-acetyltransferase
MIKEFSIFDFQKACEVFMQAFNLPPWNDEWTLETARIYLQELLDNKRFIGFTSWENDVLTGFIFCHIRYNWRGNDMTVDLMGVSPGYQRKGYGAELINAAEKYAKENSIACIGLWTSKNAPAFQFYEKLGYKGPGTDDNGVNMGKSIK